MTGKETQLKELTSREDATSTVISVLNAFAENVGEVLKLKGIGVIGIHGDLDSTTDGEDEFEEEMSFTSGITSQHVLGFALASRDLNYVTSLNAPN